MNSRMLKIVAIVTMTIDHVGYFLFPSQLWFRVVGRIAMPLFCFMIAYGATKTRNQIKYAVRLLVFAIIFQIFYSIAVFDNFFDFTLLNVFFTLSLGAFGCWGLSKKNIAYPLITIPIILFLSFFFKVEYGLAGTLLIILFYLIYKNPKLKLISLITSNYSDIRQQEDNQSTNQTQKSEMLLVYPLLSLAIFCAVSIFNIVLYFFDSSSIIQFYSMSAIVFILMLKDKKLKISKLEKWTFYLYYPLHIIVIYAISLL